jgi:serine/threonine-protein kinase HipA
LSYNKEQIDEFSREIIANSMEGIPMQTKLFLKIEKNAGNPFNFIIVGSGGSYILKPSTNEHTFLPELEDLTMHLASLAKIKTALHSLVRLQSGELAHIIQRIDRTKKGKLPIEDMCQLTGTLTEDKYNGSMEKIGKVIHFHSSNPGLDAISFFELTLFCFLTGISDMHLKKFSLLTSNENDVIFAPAFDLVPTHLVFPEKQEEMGLSVNGKKKKLKRADFDALADKLKINSKSLENIYKRFHNLIPDLLKFVDISFLNEDMKNKYKDLIQVKAKKLFEEVEIEPIQESPEAIDVPQNADPFSSQLSLFD